MGIDLLENSELGALSQSRLGNKCFVDDDEHYANFFLAKWYAKGINTVFGTNLSAPTKKDQEKKKQASIADVNKNWAIDESKSKDCNYLQQRLTELTNLITSETSKNPSKTTQDRYINPLKGWEVFYKNKVAQNKCVEKQLAEEQDIQAKKNVDLAKQIADTPLGSILPEEATTKSNLTKYVLIGVGGLVLVITAIALIKRRS